MILSKSIVAVAVTLLTIAEPTHSRSSRHTIERLPPRRSPFQKEGCISIEGMQIAKPDQCAHAWSAGETTEQTCCELREWQKKQEQRMTAKEVIAFREKQQWKPDRVCCLSEDLTCLWPAGQPPFPVLLSGLDARCVKNEKKCRANKNQFLADDQQCCALADGGRCDKDEFCCVSKKPVIMQVPLNLDEIDPSSAKCKKKCKKGKEFALEDPTCCPNEKNEPCDKQCCITPEIEEPDVCLGLEGECVSESDCSNSGIELDDSCCDRDCSAGGTVCCFQIPDLCPDPSPNEYTCQPDSSVCAESADFSCCDGCSNSEQCCVTPPPVCDANPTTINIQCYDSSQCNSDGFLSLDDSCCVSDCSLSGQQCCGFEPSCPDPLTGSYTCIDPLTEKCDNPVSDDCCDDCSDDQTCCFEPECNAVENSLMCQSVDSCDDPNIIFDDSCCEETTVGSCESNSQVCCGQLSCPFRCVGSSACDNNGNESPGLCPGSNQVCCDFNNNGDDGFDCSAPNDCQNRNQCLNNGGSEVAGNCNGQQVCCELTIINDPVTVVTVVDRR